MNPDTTPPPPVRRVRAVRQDYPRLAQLVQMNYTVEESGRLAGIIGLVQFGTQDGRPLRETAAPEARLYRVTHNNVNLADDPAGWQLTTMGPARLGDVVVGCDVQAGDTLSLYFDLGGQEPYKRLTIAFCLELP